MTDYGVRDEAPRSVASASRSNSDDPDPLAGPAWRLFLSFVETAPGQLAGMTVRLLLRFIWKIRTKAVGQIKSIRQVPQTPLLPRKSCRLRSYSPIWCNWPFRVKITTRSWTFRAWVGPSPNS